MLNFDERYLCTFLAAGNKIADLEILLNFYNELAESTLKAKDVAVLQLKLKWFMQCLLENEYKSNYQIIDSLRERINFYKLDPLVFAKIIETKNIDLDTFPFSSEADLINYAKNTGGALWKLIAQVLGGSSYQELKVVELWGRAFAILGIIRNFPFNYNRNIYTLLYDYKQLGQDSDQILQKNIKSLLKVAQKLIKEAKQIKVPLSKELKILSLLNLFTLAYGQNLRRANYDVFKANIYKVSNFTYLKIIIKFISIKIFNY
ncbi:Squalene/phytoene synthase [Candidatus Hepatincolaceae symbiont of Richtersius coronifer]